MTAAAYLGGHLACIRGTGVNHTAFQDAVAEWTDAGALADGTLRCPWHGSVFRLADGKPLRGPAATWQPAWEVRVDGERVQVRSARN